ncbi:hypothetical protein J2X68_002275 [Streptomyces sp. 3330]|uniref:hypothetical protein n=1 Tax=Streptomyces sp. 3330 TaxID=2817755 RepID=UPI00285EF1EB|nr:hypothetical protein [Streptomyces sp. 3330]MDR6975591.1 hypothetical protein [Streptomyces sp. 3330]
MGERLNDGAGHGRRHAHPADATAEDARLAEAAADAAAGAALPLEALLVRALSAQDPPGDGELRAVAAFRAARDAGAHQARTRRRDDWRPRARRHTARSLRASLSVLVAGLALGGAAFAAVGSSADGGADGAARSGPSATPTGSGARAGAGSAASASVSDRPAVPDGPDRPVSAGDTDAHCRAYEKVQGRGQAMDSTAWQRLVTAAGGEANVTAYCAAVEASRSAMASGAASSADGSTSGKDPEADETPQNGRSPEADRTHKAASATQAGRTPEAEKSGKATGSGAEGR